MNDNKDIKRLELKILGAIKQIKEGTSSPKETGIGMLFKHLKDKDEPLYEKLMVDYKKVFAVWKLNNPG